MGFQTQIETTAFAYPVAAALVTFLSAQRDTVSGLVSRAEQLAAALRPQSLEFIICHADIDVGNIPVVELAFASVKSLPPELQSTQW